MFQFATRRDAEAIATREIGVVTRAGTASLVDLARCFLASIDGRRRGGSRGGGGAPNDDSESQKTVFRKA